MLRFVLYSLLLSGTTPSTPHGKFYIKRINPQFGELATVLQERYRTRSKDKQKKLQHNTVTLVHPDGRYVFSTVVDRGGTVRVKDEVIYHLSNGQSVIEFLFNTDIHPQRDEEAVLRGRATVERIVREYFIEKGFLPLSAKQTKTDLSAVFLADRREGVYLEFKWKARLYNVRLEETTRAQGEPCPSGKVRGVVVVEGGVVISFQPSSTYLDAEGVMDKCWLGNAAAYLSLPLRGSPVLRYKGNELAISKVP